MSGVLADKLQVWGLEDDYIIFSDGSLGFCLEVQPIDVSCWDEVGMNDLHFGLCGFLNALPSGIDIQFIQDICSGNDQIISDNQKLCLNSKQEKIKELSLKRIEKLKLLDENGSLPVHRLKILVRKKLSSSLVSRKRLFLKDHQFVEMSESNLNAELKKCHRIKEDVQSSLLSVGLNSSLLDSRAVVNELYLQWNPVRDVELESYDPTDLRNSVL